MERTEAQRILASLRQEVEVTERRLASLRKLVDGYVELFPDLADDEQPQSETAPDGDQPESEDRRRRNRPRGQEAVRQVLIEAPYRPYTVSAMVEELRRRDWLPVSDEPANAVRAALKRLTVDPRFLSGREASTGTVAFAYAPDAPSDITTHNGVTLIPGQTVSTATNSVTHGPRQEEGPMAT